MDATRTDLTFLAEVIKAVTDVGTDWINIPDTCGVATPTRFGDLIRFVKKQTDACIDVHTHDDFGLATANALSGLEAGADQAQVSVNGIGERAGNAAYEEVVMAAKAVYNSEPGINTSRLMELCSLVEEISGMPIPPNKAIVGNNAFSHESGIHAAGVIENSETFEPGVMTPEMVGARRQFVLGKHTGTHAVKMHLRDAGFDPNEKQIRDITRRVKDYGSEKKRVTKKELIKFAKEENVFREKLKE
jgi:2-isopropylmalate synthase